MRRKLTCLADCGLTLYGDDSDRLGRRMRAHLRTAHRLPADPTELGAFAIPVRDDPRSDATAAAAPVTDD
jgi:hypothetical protein